MQEDIRMLTCSPPGGRDVREEHRYNSVFSVNKEGSIKKNEGRQRKERKHLLEEFAHISPAAFPER